MWQWCILPQSHDCCCCPGTMYTTSYSQSNKCMIYINIYIYACKNNLCGNGAFCHKAMTVAAVQGLCIQQATLSQTNACIEKHKGISVYKQICIYIYMYILYLVAHMGVVLYSFARDWALGPHLRGTCAYLRAHSGEETRFR